MALTILHFIMFFGPTFALVISIGQLVQARKDLIDYLFAISFFGMAIWMYQICIFSTGILDPHDCAYYLTIYPIPLIYLIPPIMVMRYRWVLSSTFSLEKSHLLMFLPCLIVLVILLYLPFSDYTDHAKYFPGLPVMSEKFSGLPFYFRLVYIIAIIPNLYVSVLMTPVLIRMLPVWGRDRHNRISKPARMGYLSALSIVLSNLLCLAGYIFSLDIVKASILFANAATIYVYLVTQRHPDYHRLLRSETRKAHYEKSRIAGLDVEKIYIRLQELMRDEKIFADEELTLRDLASELGISQHQLSQILNEKLKKNFNTFVNEYRVEEAKKMLIDEPARSILSIGIAVGFNSNTAFSTVFSKITGTTPSQFRKNRQS
ncbi:MAG TPA: helix-turn-helix domain-containing protein [Spirochaetota bacterium]|nr:helix-turn-helix domain-containing protein [Spirochaetota bacterium]HPJ34121.1 helix-turn-helix domain-containing protein [Spirochaetota bacterium]